MADGANDYENERLAQIASNEALLAELGLSENSNVVRKSIRAATETKVATPSTRKSTSKRKREPVPEDSIARRKSARLMGMEVDSPIAKQMAEEEKAKMEEVRKIARKVRAPRMTVSQMLEDESAALGSAEGLEQALTELSVKPTARPSPDRSDQRTLNKSRQSAEDKRLLEAFKGMALRGNKKITQERVYSMIVHPNPEKTMVFVGDKRGQLGIWDADAPEPEQLDDDKDPDVKEEDENDSAVNGSSKKPKAGKARGSVWRVQLHASSAISCLRFNPVDGGSLFSSSYDCSFRRFDLATHTSTELYSIPGEDDLINAFELTPTGQEAWLVDSGGAISHVDMREGGKRRRWEISGAGSGQKKIGGVSVNPVMPWLLATSGNDRVVRIWDNRYFAQLKMKPAAVAAPAAPKGKRSPSLTPPPASPSDDEKPGINGAAPISVHPDFEADYDALTAGMKKKGLESLSRGEYAHGKSCSSAYWDNWGGRLLTTSYDDRLRIFEFTNDQLNHEGAWKGNLAIKDPKAVKHDCQCGRWVTVLKSQWSQNTDYAPHFSVGNMKRKISIYSASGITLADLGDRDVITAVPAVTAAHPNHINRVFGGNSSGRIQYWAPADQD